MRTTLLILVFLSAKSSGAAEAISPKCLSPLMSTLDQAESNQKKALTYVITAPAECQYYTIGELNPETRARIFAIVKSQNKVASLDTKLSAVFGLLKLTPQADPATQKKLDPCEALFADLIEKSKSFKKADSRKDCFKISSQYLDQVKKLPYSCDNPIELTSRDFREMYQGMRAEYYRATQKQLGELLGKAFVSYRNEAARVINTECNNLR
jgi:hypothetical protein